MENIVQKYLFRCYKIKTSDAGNDGIYFYDDNIKNKSPVHYDKLLKELVIIFYIDEVTLKSYVNNWCFSVKKDVDLTFYWKSADDFISIYNI